MLLLDYEDGPMLMGLTYGEASSKVTVEGVSRSTDTSSEEGEEVETWSLLSLT